MKLGLITNNLAAFGMNELPVLARWAKQNGFSDLELGPSIPLDVKAAEQAIDETGIVPSGLIYCRNVLDPKEGAQHIAALEQRIDFAAEIGAKRVTCSTGLNDQVIVEGNMLRYDPEGCLDAVAEVFLPLLEKAAKRGIDICYEMCPMVQNIAISPYMWNRLFEKLDAPNLGLAYDPSHLVWEMIDPYTAIDQLGKKIFHVHGKDCVIDREALGQTGILHLAHLLSEKMHTGEGLHGYEHTWWYYRLPGLGTLDWKEIIRRLRAVGFDGTISIEHEDPVYSGSLQQVQQGLVMAKEHMASCL